MNSYGYDTSNDVDYAEFTSWVIKELKDKTNGMDSLIEALASGSWKLNYQEVRYIQSHLNLLQEYLLFRYQFFNSTKDIPSKNDFPIYAIVEPSSICNLRCSMCFQTDPNIRKDSFAGIMSMETFQKAIDQLHEGGCRAITFAGRGEPLVNKHFSQFLDYCSNKFYEIKINTNGLLLTEEICDAILRNNISMIVFSAEGTCQEEYEKTRVGGDFNQLISCIELFNRIKNSHYPSSSVQTRVSGVLVDRIDKKKYYDFWKKYVDEVALQEMENRNDTYNNCMADKKKPCLRLWYRTYIWFNGDCSPCDVDYLEKLKFGNIWEKPIRKMWNDEPLNSYRDKHLKGMRSYCDPCCRCEVQ